MLQFQSKMTLNLKILIEGYVAEIRAPVSRLKFHLVWKGIGVLACPWNWKNGWFESKPVIYVFANCKSLLISESNVWMFARVTISGQVLCGGHTMMCHKSFLMASSWWCPKNVCQLTPWPWNSIVLIHFLLTRPPLCKKQLADYWKLLSLNYWGMWNSIDDLNLARRQENSFKIFIKFDLNYILAGYMNLLTNSWLQWYFHLGMWIDFARRWMKLDISDMGVIVGRPACVSIVSSL